MQNAIENFRFGFQISVEKKQTPCRAYLTKKSDMKVRLQQGVHVASRALVPQSHETRFLATRQSLSVLQQKGQKNKKKTKKKKQKTNSLTQDWSSIGEL
jgi:hypothetical protein